MEDHRVPIGFALEIAVAAANLVDTALRCLQERFQIQKSSSLPFSVIWMILDYRLDVLAIGCQIDSTKEEAVRCIRFFRHPSCLHQALDLQVLMEVMNDTFLVVRTVLGCHMAVAGPIAMVCCCCSLPASETVRVVHCRAALVVDTVDHTEPLVVESFHPKEDHLQYLNSFAACCLKPDPPS